MKPRQLTAIMALSAFASGAALAADHAKLPPEKHQAGIAYLTGGVGEDEAKAFEQAAPRFPLALEFVDHVGKHNEFIAGENVKVTDAHGKTVLSTKVDGPFLLAKIPSGRYTVTATYKGKTLKRTLQVGAKAAKPAVMEWKGVA